MGKKSKSKAAKSAVIVHATSVEGGGGTSSKKNARCVKCCATVRILEGKGHQCPGCSEIYCWRCESKEFGACPNGDDCVRILRRCRNCCNGDTVQRESGLLEAGVTNVDEAIALWNERGSLEASSMSAFRKFVYCTEMIADISDKVTTDSTRMACCNNWGNCSIMECRWCLDSPLLKSLMECFRCGKIRCSDCALGNGDPIPAVTHVNVDSNGLELCQAGLTLEVTEAIRTSTPNVMVACNCCNTQVCYGCMSPEMMKRFAQSCLSFATGKCVCVSIVCDTCYWKKKPCTNPTCPNPIGIPTKRCGGCHISRYCSAACQAAAYPDHQVKCKRMQIKLAAKKGREKV